MYMAAFRSVIGQITETYKVAFRVRYHANQEHIRAKNLAKTEQFLQSIIHVNHRRSAQSQICVYVTEVICCESNIKASLKKVFTAMHDNIAQTLLQTGLTIVLCQMATQKVLIEAFNLRKYMYNYYSAGKWLGSIAEIKVTVLGHTLRMRTNHITSCIRSPVW